MAVVALTALGAFAPNANALTWTTSPNGNALAFGVTVVNGVLQINSPQGGSQPAGIYGAGFTTTGTDFSMDFDSDLYSWDSYNSTQGYYDAFIVTVSTAACGFYWNCGPTDPVATSASTWAWGGNTWFGGVGLENYTTAPGNTDNISLSGFAPGTTFYTSLVLDTKSSPNFDSIYPSWGSFHVNVLPVPEPETYAMMLAGLGLLGFSARRRKNNT